MSLKFLKIEFKIKPKCSLLKGYLPLILYKVMNPSEKQVVISLSD